MQVFNYVKAIRGEQLLEELETIPELAPVGSGMQRTARISVSFTDTEVDVAVPDGIAKSVVDAVVNAHVPTYPVTQSDKVHGEKTARTVGIQTVEIARFSIPALSISSLDLWMLAVDVGNGAYRKIVASYTIQRTGAGVSQSPTSPTIIVNQQSGGAAATTANVTGWQLSPSIDGNDIVLSVVGSVAGRTVDWFLEGDLRRFAPGGLS
jgi:hypothetical protein